MRVIRTRKALSHLKSSSSALPMLKVTGDSWMSLCVNCISFNPEIKHYVRETKATTRLHPIHKYVQSTKSVTEDKIKEFFSEDYKYREWTEKLMIYIFYHLARIVKHASLILE